MLKNAADALNRVLSWRVLGSLMLATATLAWMVRAHPFPEPGVNAFLDLIALEDPPAYAAIKVWYFALPGIHGFLAGMFVSAVPRIWRTSRRRDSGRGKLPGWPLKTDDETPSLVVGELHHPTAAREVPSPRWLTLPERGLYTGIAIFGAIGSGKTSACMHPFARQLFHWRADDPQRRAAGLVLEVKGDFCHDVKALLADAGREEDYLELGLGGNRQWNPLDSEMDSYSLAYTIASLLNQLFGKGKEPFWQQAYTNLVRWLIELHWLFPGHWCTLRDVYRCTIDPELFSHKLDEAKKITGAHLPSDDFVVLEQELWMKHLGSGLAGFDWRETNDGKRRAVQTDELAAKLNDLKIKFEIQTGGGPQKLTEHQARLDAVNRWYKHDWSALDNKLRTSIVEGVSVFLSMFDLPDVARVFCPEERPRPRPPADDDVPPPPKGLPTSADGALLEPLPALHDLIEGGKVLALNMPAGASPALGRAIGVMLKNAWLDTLKRRPAAMQRYPNRYFRPAVFLCDEYQSFATVGEDDPSGDEKAFALLRQSKGIPIVATQSISSLRSVLGGHEAWRTLLQTLRTKIFLTLSDDSSADLASNMCGKIRRLAPSYSFTEQTKPGFSLFSGRPGGAKGSLGASKSYREQREPMFHPRTFSLLENYQAIVIPSDGAQALPATRAYLKPYYLPRNRSYWRQREAREI